MNEHKNVQCGTRHLAAEFFIATGGGLIAFVFAVYLIALGGLALNYGIPDYTVAFSLAAILLWGGAIEAYGKNRWAILVLAALLALFVLYTSYDIASRFFDISWDGMAYHQGAILLLLEGWNPLTEPIPKHVAYATQIEAYPKAVWLIAAAIQQIDGDLEAAKGLHFVLAAAAFFLLFGAFLKLHRLSAWAAGLLSVTAALNPVVIYQSLSFYVDGLLGSLFTALIALSILLLYKFRWRLVVIFSMVLILLINTKQTGILYGALGCLTLLAMLWTRNGPWLQVSGATLASGLLAIGLFGYSPYVTNTLEHGHPLYPIFGGERADFELGHRPPGLDEISGPERLFHSTLAKPTLAPKQEPELKIPFLTNSDEIKIFRGADIRLGGWGVLFSGGLMLGIIGLLLVWAAPKGYRSVGLVLLFGVIFTVLANPEAWWARFAPQWVLVPLIVGGLLLSSSRRSVRIFGFSLAATLLMNGLLVAFSYYPFQANYTMQQKDHLEKIAATETLILVDFGDFPANRVRLENAGIRYVELRRRLPCRKPHRIFPYQGSFCFAGVR